MKKFIVLILLSLLCFNFSIADANEDGYMDLVIRFKMMEVTQWLQIQQLL